MGSDKALMPLLFVGHGSPMNAIEENEFVDGWRKMSAAIPRPEAILCVSAHWETKGSHVTAMEWPATIHDFGGFPRSLYEIEYPAPGNPGLAKDTIANIKSTVLGQDFNWGLDHGSWSVLHRMYPAADIPVIQMSLDYTKTSQAHYDLAKELSFLRRKGILIIGSGNIVHNLRLVDWSKVDVPEFGFDWALEADKKVKQLILDGDHKSLIGFRKQGRAFDLAIPTPEHFLPLLYILALKEENEPLEFFNDRAVMGSLTMTSVRIG